MSLLLLEGWDLYGTASNVVPGNWTEVVGTPVISLTGGKNNDPHVIFNSTADILRHNHGTITSTTGIIVGFQYKVETLVQQRIINFTQGNDLDLDLARLRLETDGSLSIQEEFGGQAVVASTAAGVITAGVWHVVELRIKPASGSGVSNAEAEIRVDGTIVLNVASISLDSGDSPFATTIGKTELRGGTGVNHFGDVYMLQVSGVLNNDFAGDFNIQTLIPEADTGTASWTAVNAGDHFEEVNDGSTPDGDTSYVSAQISTEADIYTLTDLTGDVGAVLGYSPLVLARREIGSTQNIAVRLIGASETVDFSGRNLATTYEMRAELRSGSVDDLTNSTYPTISEVNALQAGVFIP